MIDTLKFRADGLRKKTLRCSYNYCGICGHTPRTNADEPNYAPLRWWDPDDGWKIGTLCHYCHDEFGNTRPKPGDFAFSRTNEVCDDCNTDEDPSLVIESEGSITAPEPRQPTARAENGGAQ